jgi:hypothetical protein
MLAELTQEIKMKLFSDIRCNATSLAITFDLWTSLAKHSYVGVTAHWITPKFEQKSGCILIGELPGHHTAQNIAKAINPILDEIAIPISAQVIGKLKV